MITKRLVAALMTAGIMMTARALATAQGQETQPASNQPTTHELKASDKVLRRFAKVYVEAQKLAARPQAPVTEQHPEGRPADADLQKVLEQQGLTADTYNRIAASVNHNDQARTRVIELIEEERARS